MLQKKIQLLRWICSIFSINFSEIYLLIEIENKIVKVVCLSTLRFFAQSVLPESLNKYLINSKQNNNLTLNVDLFSDNERKLSQSNHRKSAATKIFF